jgi:hypothetical protein
LIISVFAAVLLGAFVYLLWRYARLPLWQVAVCALFGYFLASSSIGPDIAHALTTLARLVARLHF